MVEHRDNAGYAQRLGSVDAQYAAAGDGTGHHAAMEQAVFWVFARIACLAGDFSHAIHAIQRGTDYRFVVDHGHAPTPAARCAASVNARTIARCASVTLKPLWVSGCAP